MKPLGYNVLIEMENVDEVSPGGIVLPSELTDKEQAVTCIGWIRDIGPTAWEGYPGCEKTVKIDDPVFGTMDKQVPPHECWGVQIGDKVEFEKYAGIRSCLRGFENYRTIPDSKIVNLIERVEK